MNEVTAKDAKRVGIYRRVSTEDQARSRSARATEGYSLPEQERRPLAYIKAHDGWEHVETYTDAGFSGTDPNRPDLNRLLGDLHRLDVVIVVALDRLGRNAKLLLDLYDRLDAGGVALVSVKEAIDGTTASGRMFRTILAAFAEFERENIIERTSVGIAASARDGKPWGPYAPYGYVKAGNGESPPWLPEPHEQAVQRRVMEALVKDGTSVNGIAKMLDEGIAPRRGKRWSASVLLKMLKSRYALGEYLHQDEWLKGSHEPFITEDEWLRVQAELERRAKFRPSGARGRLPKRHLFVRGFLRCGLCGEAMLPRSDSRKGGQTDTYVCRTRKAKGTGACAMPIVSRAEFDEVMVGIFASDDLDYVRTRERLASKLAEHGALISGEIERAEGEVSTLVARLARIQRDYHRGALSAESYEEMRLSTQEEQKAATEEAARLRARAAEVAEAGQALDADETLRERLEALRRVISAEALTALEMSEATGDINALRAAFGRVYVRAECKAYPSGRVGGMLEMRDDLIPTLIEFPARSAENNLSASGVPE